MPFIPTACPGYQMPSCAPRWKNLRHLSTHASYSPLGGLKVSVQPNSHKDKIEMQNPSIALNRTDWIRIFLLSSQLDPLSHWGPEGRLAPDRGRTAAESREAPQHRNRGVAMEGASPLHLRSPKSKLSYWPQPPPSALCSLGGARR